MAGRGRAAAVDNDLDRAIVDFDAALIAEPGSADRWADRSRAWSQKKDYQKALADVNEAIRLKPKEAYLYLGRARFHYWGKDYEKAGADYAKAFQLEPDNCSICSERSRLSGANGNITKALEVIDDGLRAGLEDADLLAVRGGCLYELKRFDEARAEVDRAIALDPFCTKALVVRGSLLLAAGQDESALADYNKAISLGLESAELYLARAGIRQRRLDYARVIPDLQKVIRLDPNNITALAVLGSCLATNAQPTLEQARRALTFAKKAAELTKNQNPQLLETLALAHSACRDFREAARWQKEAIQLYPQDGPAVQAARQRLDYYEKSQPMP